MTKVMELMTALDQVKKYRAFSRLLLDFAAIVLCSVVLLLALELTVNFFKIASGFPCYYSTASMFICGSVVGGSQASPIVQLLAGLSLFLIPAIGVLVGVFWVDRKLRSVRGGEWREAMKEGFPGALRLLQALDWDSVLEDMRISKIGYAVYSVIKVLGYWLLAFIILFFPYGFGISLLHTGINFYVLGLISLILVLVLIRRDLGRRYRQVVSLDAITWELRWFNSEFKRPEFGETGTIEEH